jgi:hypothetical protein
MSTALSYAGLLIFGIVVVVFASLISTVLTSTIIAIVNSTTLLTNESVTYTVGNYTVSIGLPSNPFARDIVNGLTWLLIGLLHIVSDPFLLVLVVILSLVIIVIGARLTIS